MHFALKNLLYEAQNNLKIFKVRCSEFFKEAFVPQAACLFHFIIFVLI